MPLPLGSSCPTTDVGAAAASSGRQSSTKSSRIVSLSFFVAKSSLVVITFATLILHARNRHSHAVQQSKLKGAMITSRSDGVVAALADFWDYWRRIIDFEENNEDRSDDSRNDSQGSVESLRALNILADDADDDIILSGGNQRLQQGNRVECYVRDRLHLFDKSNRVGGEVSGRGGAHGLGEALSNPPNSAAASPVQQIQNKTEDGPANSGARRSSFFGAGLVASFIWPSHQCRDPAGDQDATRRSAVAVAPMTPSSLTTTTTSTALNQTPTSGTSATTMTLTPNGAANPPVLPPSSSAKTFPVSPQTTQTHAPPPLTPTPNIGEHPRLSDAAAGGVGVGERAPSLVSLTPAAPRQGVSFGSSSSGLVQVAGDSLLTAMGPADTFGRSSDVLSPSYASLSLSCEAVGLPHSAVSVGDDPPAMGWLPSLFFFLSHQKDGTCQGDRTPRRWWRPWRRVTVRHLPSSSSTTGSPPPQSQCVRAVGSYPRTPPPHPVSARETPHGTEKGGSAPPGGTAAAASNAASSAKQIPDLLSVPFITGALSSLFRPLIPTLGRCPTVVVMRVCPASEDSEQEIEEYVNDLKRQLQLDSSASEDDLVDIVCILESDCSLGIATTAAAAAASTANGFSSAVQGQSTTRESQGNRGYTVFSSSLFPGATGTSSSSATAAGPRPPPVHRSPPPPMAYLTVPDGTPLRGGSTRETTTSTREAGHMTLEVYPARMFYLTLYLALLLQEKNNAILSVFGGPKISSCVESPQKKKQSTSSPFSPFSRSSTSTPPPSLGGSRQTPLRSSKPFGNSLPSPVNIFSPKSRRQRRQEAKAGDVRVPEKRLVNIDWTWVNEVPTASESNIRVHQSDGIRNSALGGGAGGSTSVKVMVVEEVDDEMAAAESDAAERPLKRRKGREGKKTTSSRAMRRLRGGEDGGGLEAEKDSVATLSRTMSGAAADVAGAEYRRSASGSTASMHPNSNVGTPTTRDPAPFLPSLVNSMSPPLSSPVRHKLSTKLTPLSTCLESGGGSTSTSTRGGGGVTAGGGAGSHCSPLFTTTTSSCSRFMPTMSAGPGSQEPAAGLPSVGLHSRFLFASLSRRSTELLKAADQLMDDIREKMDENVKAFWEKKMEIRCAAAAAEAAAEAAIMADPALALSSPNPSSPPSPPPPPTHSTSHTCHPSSTRRCSGSGETILGSPPRSSKTRKIQHLYPTTPAITSGSSGSSLPRPLSAFKYSGAFVGQPVVLPTVEDMAALIEELEMVSRETSRDRVLARVRSHSYTVCSIPLPDHRIYRSVPPSVARCAVACARGFCLYRSLTDDAVHYQQYILHVLEQKRKEAMRAGENSAEETPREVTGKRAAVLKKLSQLMDFAYFSFQRSPHSTTATDQRGPEKKKPSTRTAGAAAVDATTDDPHQHSVEQQLLTAKQEEEALRAQRINEHFLAVSSTGLQQKTSGAATKTILYSVEESGAVNVLHSSTASTMANQSKHRRSNAGAPHQPAAGSTAAVAAPSILPDSAASPNPSSSTRTHSPTFFYENPREARRAPKLWSGMVPEDENRSLLSRRGSLLISSSQVTSPQTSHIHDSAAERIASAACSFRYGTPLDYSSSVCSVTDGACSSMGSRSVSCLMEATGTPIVVPPLPTCRELLLWLRGAFSYRCCAVNVERVLLTNGSSRLNWMGHGKIAFFVLSNATARLFCASVGDEVDDDMEWLREEGEGGPEGSTSAIAASRVPSTWQPYHLERSPRSPPVDYLHHHNGGRGASLDPGLGSRGSSYAGQTAMGTTHPHPPLSGAATLPSFGGQQFDDEADEFIDVLKRHRSIRNRPLYPLFRFLHQQFFDTLTRPTPKSQVSSVVLTPSPSQRNSVLPAPAASPSALPSPFSLNPLEPTSSSAVGSSGAVGGDGVRGGSVSLPPPLTLSTAALSISAGTTHTSTPSTAPSATTNIFLVPPRFTANPSCPIATPVMSPEGGGTTGGTCIGQATLEKNVGEAKSSPLPSIDDTGAGTGAALPTPTPPPSLECFGGYRIPLDALDKNNGHYGLTPLEVWLSSRYSLRTAAEVYVMDVAASRGDPYISSVRVIDEVVAHAVYVYHNRSLLEFVIDLNTQFQLKYVPQTAWGRRALDVLPWVRANMNAEPQTGGEGGGGVPLKNSGNSMNGGFTKCGSQSFHSSARLEGQVRNSSSAGRAADAYFNLSSQGMELGTDHSELPFVGIDASSDGSSPESDEDNGDALNSSNISTNHRNNTWDMDLDAYSMEAFGVDRDEESLAEELEFLKLFLISHRLVLSSAMLTPTKANRLESLFGVPSTVFPFLLCQRESVALVYSIYHGLTEHYGELTYHHFYQFMLDVFGGDRPEVVRHTPRIFRTLNRSRTGCISYEEICGWLARKLSCGTQQKPDLQLMATLTSLRLHMALVTDRKDIWEHRDFIMRSLSEGEEEFH